MTKHPPPRALLRFLDPYDGEIRRLALDVRAVVLQQMAPCKEYIYDAYNAVALGYGSTDRLKDGICHIAVYARHVNLGFNQGARLEDPEGLLEGSGKQVRHLTLKTVSDLERPEIRMYLRRAHQQAHYTAEAGTKRKAVVSVVKGASPIKRRPGPSRQRA